jgi:hypothetical protein
MEESKVYPKLQTANMLVITEQEFRKALVEFYASFIEQDAEDMLTHGNTGPMGKMMQVGVDNMGLTDLLEAADPWLSCTMDCDDSIDGVIIWDNLTSKSHAVVAVHDFEEEGKKDDQLQ